MLLPKKLCKDSTSTYYEGITTLKSLNQEEIEQLEGREDVAVKQQHAQWQAKRFENYDNSGISESVRTLKK